MGGFSDILVVNDGPCLAVKEVLRQTTPCDWSKYSSDKKERAQRLYFVLRQSLASFPKAMSLFRIYDLSKANTNGFEVLRLLKEECGLATRAEALFFCECALNFRVSSKLGSLRDFITRLEAELLLQQDPRGCKGPHLVCRPDHSGARLV